MDPAWKMYYQDRAAAGREVRLSGDMVFRTATNRRISLVKDAPTFLLEDDHLSKMHSILDFSMNQSSSTSRLIVIRPRVSPFWSATDDGLSLANTFGGQVEPVTVCGVIPQDILSAAQEKRHGRSTWYGDQMSAYSCLSNRYLEVA